MSAQFSAVLYTDYLSKSLKQHCRTIPLLILIGIKDIGAKRMISI